MKNVLIALSVFLLAISSLKAAPDADTTNRVAQKVIAGIEIPEELKKTPFSDEVKVEFQIQPDGAVEILAVETRNPVLKKYVEAYLKKTRISENICTAAILYSVKILFKVL